MLKLRLRLPRSSAAEEMEVDLEAPWVGVLYELEARSGIDLEHLHVLSGFPPKPLAIDDSTLMKNSKLRTNDVLIIQKGDAVVRLGNTGQRYIPPTPDKAHFTRRRCPADNSCLFHACAYVLKNKSRTDGPLLREQCVTQVLSHPERYNANTLGQSNEEYAAWLRRAGSWGGAVELQILSELYETELYALDLESLMLQKFGEEGGYSLRAFVVYTGNHYDAIAMNMNYNSPSEMNDQVLFNTRDTKVVDQARRFVKEEGEKMQKG